MLLSHVANSKLTPQSPWINLTLLLLTTETMTTQYAMHFGYTQKRTPSFQVPLIKKKYNGNRLGLICSLPCFALVSLPQASGSHSQFSQFMCHMKRFSDYKDIKIQHSLLLILPISFCWILVILLVIYTHAQFAKAILLEWHWSGKLFNVTD